MKLFQPDNHTRDEVRIFPATGENRELATEAWRAAFGNAPSAVEIIEGANLNSANFRVDGSYLKVVQKAAGKDYLQRLPAFAALLSEKAIPVAPFTAQANGDFHSAFAHQGKEYLSFVQPFVSGNFCPGNRESIEQFLAIWPRLRETFSGEEPSADQRLPWNQSIPPLGPLLESARALPGLPPVLTEEIAYLLEVESRVIARPAGDWGIHHIDLHPHNFLYRGDELALLLDLESFRRIPAELSLGFGLFKLGRKGLATGRLTGEEFRHLVKPYDTKALAPWVQAELVRRITLILDLHRLGNHSWSGDLPKHLAGLREVDFLFG